MLATPEELAEAYLNLWEKCYEECFINSSHLKAWENFANLFIHQEK